MSVTRKCRLKRLPAGFWFLGSLVFLFVGRIPSAWTVGSIFLFTGSVVTNRKDLESSNLVWEQNLTAVSKVVQPHSRKANVEEPKRLRASSHPVALDWKATPETTYEVCFVTSVYASSPDLADRPPDVREIRDANPTFAFFAFTCMEQPLDAPGWTIKQKTFGYKRFITQSRWAKFMAWQDNDVRGCQAVLYMDGFCGPKLKHSDRYKRLAKEIHESEFGLFQNQHDVAKGPLNELNRIAQRNKDIAKNVKASKEWLLAQPDFRPDIPMYANHYIGYDPQNMRFQQATQFFWDRYSLELDSWRDQPLWSYVLHHFQIEPTRLGTFEALFREYYKRMGHNGHRYDVGADRNAVQHHERSQHGVSDT